MYVRLNKNRAPGSIGFQSPLSFISQMPASVGTKTISPPKIGLVGARKKPKTAQRRRAAGNAAKLKHGKTKGMK